MLFSPGFFDVAIVKQIFSPRPGQDSSSHVHGPFYFFQVIYSGFFPWSLVAVPAIGIAFWQAIQRKNREMIFLLTGSSRCSSVSPSRKMKAVWYMNPLYLPWLC